MGKLSKRERAHLVELLKCAADIVDETRLPIARAARELDRSKRLEDAAIEARFSVIAEYFMNDDEGYRVSILEAAQRVEEGTWP